MRERPVAAGCPVMLQHEGDDDGKWNRMGLGGDLGVGGAPSDSVDSNSCSMGDLLEMETLSQVQAVRQRCE